MREAGCVFVTDADRPIVDSRVMRRLLAYAGGLGVMVAHRPADPWLTAGAAASEGEFAGRMGLPSEPPAAETIMLERDVALLELAAPTGARLMVDQVSAEGALDTLRRAKDRGLPLIASASINHLTFNELDIGDYRTFWKLDPAAAGGGDRAGAGRGALASGLVDIVVSAHAPAPAEDKRLPFEEAAPGSIGLETLLPALLTLWHEGQAPLLRLLETVTLAPARAIGMPGRTPRRRRARRPGPLRSRRPQGGRRQPAAVEVEEFRLRRPPAAGPGADDGRRRPGGLGIRVRPRPMKPLLPSAPLA